MSIKARKRGSYEREKNRKKIDCSKLSNNKTKTWHIAKSLRGLELRLTKVVVGVERLTGSANDNVNFKAL